MADLTQLTLDADGTIDTANIDHDAGDRAIGFVEPPAVCSRPPADL